jgi:hypothetical protein
MFEIEDLFEYDLLEEGAFNSLQEFIDFTDGADPETIFALLKEGAFDSIEDFKDGVNFTPKKKSKLEILLLFLQRKIRNQILQLLQRKQLDLRILQT